MPATRQGVHRRSLTRAVKASWWLEPDQDAAALRAAADLADILDDLRARRMDTITLMLTSEPSKEAWHAASVHAKYQQALAGLRMTPDTRPEQVADDTADLITDLKRSLMADDSPAD